MARDESNREDLLREATALVERIELIPNGAADNRHIIAGFRRDGALSIFFGEDPVYQFNAAGELRRAYHDGKLLKATDGRLAALQRVRTQTEVQLVRHELTLEEESAFMNHMEERLRDFAERINTNLFQIAGKIPAETDVLGRLKSCLATYIRRQIAAKPNA
jgi:hypothetical protein